jgi:hypothetical protein
MRRLLGFYEDDYIDDDYNHSQSISYLDFFLIGLCISLLISIIFFIKLLYKKYNPQVSVEQRTESLTNRETDKEIIELEWATYNPTKDYIPEQCTICISEFTLDEKLTTLECGHTYHHACITEWYQKNQACPICK